MLQNNTRGEEELMKVFETIVHGNEQDLMQENANVDGRSPMGEWERSHLRVRNITLLKIYCQIK